MEKENAETIYWIDSRHESYGTHNIGTARTLAEAVKKTNANKKHQAFLSYVIRWQEVKILEWDEERGWIAHLDDPLAFAKQYDAEEAELSQGG